MDSKNINKERYEEYYKSVSLFKATSPGNRWLFDLINEIFDKIDSDSVEKILDVGCGEGSKTYLLKKQLPEANVLGIDFSLSGIESAKKQQGKNGNSLGVEFRCIDAEDLSVWDEKFDMISCLGVLEHIDNWKSLVDKFVSSSNNYILLEVPVGRMRKSEIYDGHVRNFKKGELENYLAGQNFYPVKIYYAGFPFLNPIGRDIRNVLYRFYHLKIEFENKPTMLTKLYSNIFYFLLKNCSTKYRFGDQFLGLFKKQI